MEWRHGTVIGRRWTVRKLCRWSPIIGASLKGLRTDAQRAIQFTRSTPEIDVALVGMSDITHVKENLEMVKIPPATEDEYLSLF